MPYFLFRQTSSEKDYPEEIIVFRHPKEETTKERFIEIACSELVHLFREQVKRSGNFCAHFPASDVRGDFVKIMAKWGFVAVVIAGDIGVEMNHDTREWFHPSHDGAVEGEPPIYIPRFSGDDGNLFWEYFRNAWKNTGGILNVDARSL